MITCINQILVFYYFLYLVVLFFSLSLKLTHVRTNMLLIFIKIAVAWSVESLPSNPVARVRFPAGAWDSECVAFFCVLSCVVFGGGPDIVLTTHSWRAALVYLSSVLVRRQLLPYRHLAHGHLGFKSLGTLVLDWRRVNI